MIPKKQIFLLKNVLMWRNVAKSACGSQARFYCCKTGQRDSCGKKQYMEPKGKVALITGGATGIGLAIANEFLCSNLCRVIIGGIDPCVGKAAAKQLNDTHGKDKCCFVHMNVACPKQFEDVFKEITDKFGSVDILVNNVGIMNDKKWEYEIDINMKSVVRGTMIALKYMQNQKRKGGVIINNADALIFDNFPFTPIYIGTKYAVLGLSRSFGDEFHYGKTGVRVIALCPGVTETNMLKHIGENQLEESWGKEATAALKAKTIQKPAAVGQAVVYLVEFAPPGSTWLVEGSQLFNVKVPNKKNYMEKVTQF